MVTNALINRIINYLNTDITHIGIGTGAAPMEIDTTLASEQLRKAAQITIDGHTLIFDAYWDESEGNGITFTNAGCFGNGANGTISTGELFVGGGISITKDNKQSLTISIELSIEAVN